MNARRFAALMAFGCGSAEHDRGAPGQTSDSGGAAAGSISGTSGAAGAHADPVDGLFQTLERLCDQVRTCYPTKAMDGSSCLAPGDGMSVVWFAPTGTLAEALRYCLQDYPDQAALEQWASCRSSALAEETQCLGACPYSVVECVNTGNIAIAACTDTALEAYVDTCL
jgi:hypothetical protein